LGEHRIARSDLSSGFLQISRPHSHESISCPPTSRRGVGGDAAEVAAPLPQLSKSTSHPGPSCFESRWMSARRGWLIKASGIGREVVADADRPADALRGAEVVSHPNVDCDEPGSRSGKAPGERWIAAAR
jgi:hypothetical protein